VLLSALTYTLSPTPLNHTLHIKHIYPHIHRYVWAVDHIRVDTRGERFRVLFEIQLNKSRKGELLTRLQAQWRRAVCANMKLRPIYDEFMVKVNVRPEADSEAYYVDRRTGVSQWEKPRLLGTHTDLTDQPSHRWVELVYEHDGEYFQHFVNPWTGKYSHYTQDQAIRIMQVRTSSLSSPVFLVEVEVEV